MKNRNLTLLLLAAILILACSCPLVGATGVNPPGTASPTVLSTTETPTTTALATFGATPSVGVPTSSIPLASPNGQPVNCRSGPGTSWPVVIVLQPGQTAEITGHSADGMWWYVKNPTLQGNFCWISSGFAITTGNLNGIPVVAAPPTIAAPPTVVSAGVVTSVSVSLSKDSIHVAGCMGPIQPVTIYATIDTNGPVKLQWHFDTEQSGSLATHSLNFKGAGSKDVQDSFTPPVTAGKYRVELVIDGMNLKGMNGVVFYTISC